MELANISQQCHMSVMGHNSIPPSKILSQDPEVCGRPMGLHAQLAGFETKADCRVVMVNGKVQKRVLEEQCQGI